eukprot:4570087-Pyramimonas_sp.AAC.1
MVGANKTGFGAACEHLVLEINRSGAGRRLCPCSKQPRASIECWNLTAVMLAGGLVRARSGPTKMVRHRVRASSAGN